MGASHSKVKIEDIRKHFLTHRNLGEDLGKIVILEAEQLIIHAQVGIRSEVIGEYVLANILYELQRWLQPPVPAHTLQELEDAGLSYEEIFNGPRPKSGFLRTGDLKALQKSFNVSDIREIIGKVEGVESVGPLQVWKDGDQIIGRWYFGWPDEASGAFELSLKSARAPAEQDRRTGVRSFK